MQRSDRAFDFAATRRRINVFDLDALELIQTASTRKGAHTVAFDPAHNKTCAFLPETHAAAVLQNRD